MFPVQTDTLFASETAARGGEALVSVVVTLFNYGGYLPECLGSVAAQTHPRLELIVVDDASSDDSAALAQAWLCLLYTSPSPRDS